LGGYDGVLETFTATPTFVAGNGFGSLNLSFGSATSISDLLASDLGYANSATTAITGGHVDAGAATLDSGSATSGSGSATFAPNSDTLTATLSGVPAPAVPEPVSFLLLGSGLLGVALVARRRSVKV